MGIVIAWARDVLFWIPFIDVPVYNYGLWLGLAYLASWACVESDVKRKKMKIDSTISIFLALVVGMGSSKAVMILISGSWSLYTGYSFQGGIVGGLIALLVYFQIIGQRKPPILDTAATAVAIGHAVGKVGCFMAADGCYGVVTKMPWGMSFPNGAVPTTQFVHPTPIYEGGLSFAIWAYLWFTRHSWKRELDQGWTFLILMGGQRFIIETIRGHSVEWYGLSIYQLWAFCTMMIGFVLLIVSRTFNWFPIQPFGQELEATDTSADTSAEISNGRSVTNKKKKV